MMKRNRGGVLLTELLVYMGLFATALALLGPLVKEGFELCETTTRITQSAHAAQRAFEWIGRDLRCASQVELGRAEVPWGPVPLLIRFEDGTGAAYTIRDHALKRIELSEETELRADADMSDVRVGEPVTGEFAELRVKPVPGAQRVYRIDLLARIRRMVGEKVRYEEARFRSAVQIRGGMSQ